MFNALITLDGIRLTDQGRTPLEVSRDERSIEVELANGDLKKYVKGVKKTFSMTWAWLPDSDDDTIDGHAARHTIASNFASSGNSHELMLEAEDGFVEMYIVYISSYSETLKRRTPNGAFWDVSLELKEK